MRVIWTMKKVHTQIYEYIYKFVRLKKLVKSSNALFIAENLFCQKGYNKYLS